MARPRHLNEAALVDRAAQQLLQRKRPTLAQPSEDPVTFTQDPGAARRPSHERLTQAVMDVDRPPLADAPRPPVQTMSNALGRQSAPAGGWQIDDTPMGAARGTASYSTNRQDAAMNTGSPFSQFYQDYRRRREGAGGALRGAVSGAGTGASIGSMFAGVGAIPGAIIGGALGGITGAFTKNAKTAYSDLYIDDAKQILADAWRFYLGREADPAHIDAMIVGQGAKPGHRWVGQGGLDSLISQLANSEEALQYRALDAAGAQAAGEAPNTSRAQMPPLNAPAEYTGPPPGSAVPHASANPETVLSGPGGQTGSVPGTPGGSDVMTPERVAELRAAIGAAPSVPFTGFDFNRAQDPSMSAKDAFASVAQRLGGPTDTSKTGAEEWWQSVIAPELAQLGYKTYDVQGDKAWVESREDPSGRSPVDFLVNAGGANPMLGWQVDAGGGNIAPSGATNVQDAYAALQSMISPNASRAEMEAAVAAAFGGVPGFEQAYAGDVVINGQKIDLITDFEGMNPQWSNNLAFQPLHPGGQMNLAGLVGQTTGAPLSNDFNSSLILQYLLQQMGLDRAAARAE